jgi:pimeloyl-ACP methyl ester carboxylesterase
MSKWDLSDRVDSCEVSTPRLATHLLQSGPVDGTPLLFVHGNVASSVFFEETLVAIPPGYRGSPPTCGASASQSPDPSTPPEG